MFRQRILTQCHRTFMRYQSTGQESLVQRLKQDRKLFMKEKKQPELNVVKGLLSDLTYHLKSGNESQQDEEEALLTVLRKAIKRRQDSVEQYLSGGRPELASQEQQEIEVLHRYQPAQMGSDEIEKELRTLMSELNATSVKDMGKVLKSWPHSAAVCDRKLVVETFKRILK